ncbi:DNA (cytosine-5)-methyltransferase 1 [Rhizobium sp. PP-WC-2G-219]|nr:DNA (cytosine-5)-methyltransferase 1 [Rhizobium sp. PP-WC-2G-219]
MSLGACRAGIQVRAAIEIHPAAAKTFSANHPSAKLYRDDIRRINQVDLGPRDREVVLFGGPPCQGFSTSNQRTRNNQNQKNWLFLEFIRFVEEIQPDWVVFENVAGILQTENGRFVNEIKTRLDQLGYGTSSGLISAQDVGVPQRRTRFFMIGRKYGTPPSITNDMPQAKSVTVREAIGDLPDLANGDSFSSLPYKSGSPSDYACLLRGEAISCSGHLVTKNADHILQRYSFIPEGGNWQDIPEEHMKTYADRFRCHTGIYRRLRWDEPSVVLGNYRKNMLVHPKQNRGLSVREAARLQSFPDSYEFHGSIGLQQQQVGNAVPPQLAAHVFSKITGI